MGLMSKFKNILFEEEEVEIPIIDKKKSEIKREEPVYKEMPKKEEPVVKQAPKTSFYDDLEPVIKAEKKLEDEHQEMRSLKTEAVSEKELFTNEKTFNFPAFDEEEFESAVPKRRENNVLEYEKKEAIRREKNEYKRVEEKQVTEKVKFKPSPIISPVYGILDKNYTPDEITTRSDSGISRKLDVDTVRKKAFGEKKEEEPKAPLKETPSEITIEKTSDDLILEEKLEKARTIDELLKDSSDDYITLKPEEEKKPTYDDFAVEEDLDNSADLDMAPDALEDDAVISLDHLDEPKEEADDTLESDLFDLIDSMYENREDGE